jgi:hypothetical protein
MKLLASLYYVLFLAKKVDGNLKNRQQTEEQDKFYNY